MRVAICFTGQCRSLENTHESIKKYLIEPLSETCERVDIFAFIDENKHTHKFLEYIKPTQIVIQRDEHIDDTFVRRHSQKNLQQYIQMLNGYKQVNELRKSYEKKENISYDCVVRCRLDIELIRKIPDILSMDMSKVYLPDFHSWSHVTEHSVGFNDRFAFSSPENMDVYFSQIDNARQFCEEGGNLHAETFLAHNLLNSSVEVEKINFRFVRIREHNIRVESDTNIVSTSPEDWQWWYH